MRSKLKGLSREPSHSSSKSPPPRRQCRGYDGIWFWTAGPKGDPGFTLIELMVSMLVLSLAMMGLTGVFISSAKTIGQAKQRQQATALATRSMEQLRALPYDLIVSGINRSTASFAADARIINKATTPRFTPGISGIDEALVVNTTGTTEPLSPHIKQVTLESTTYTVSTYVTKGPTTQPSYNLTVLVTYGIGTTDTQNTVMQRSTSYSPVGCLSTSTHPFSGPCQPSFSAQAGVTAGSISLVPSAGDTGAEERLMQDFGVTSASLDLPMLSSSLRVEQTSRVSASAQLSGARLVSTTTDLTSGGESQMADSDTDPSSDLPLAEDFTQSPTNPAALQESGQAGSLTISPSNADSGSGSASVSGGSACKDPASGSLVSSSQPCGSASVTGSGAPGSVSVELSEELPRALTAIPVAQVAPDPSVSRALAGQFTSSTSFCSGASPNCAVAAVRRDLGTVTAGNLPALEAGDSGPGSSFTGVIKVMGLVDTARAESGVGARVPPLATRSGTVTYWDEATQTDQSISLASLAEAQSLEGSVSRRYAGPGDQDVRVDIDYVISVQPAVTSSVTTPCDSVTPCTAKVESGPTVHADMRYRVFELDEGESTAVTAFAVVVDLGGVLAETSYRRAPDA